MKKYTLLLAFFAISLTHAQDENQVNEDAVLDESKKEEKPPITDYKIISIQNDTTYVDTTLSIQKDYNFNYLRRDDFGLVPIHNVGQSYTSLIKQPRRNKVLPLFGARARHFNFIEANDIHYYHVPTPLTELYFKTTFEQGQQADAFFTINTSERLNLSIAYKGVRSLGKYQHALTESGNFRSTISYRTKNNRYTLRSHFVSQKLINEENGGLSEEGKQQYLGQGEFIGQEEDFEERASIAVNFTDAENRLSGRRFFLNHSYAIIAKSDSINNGIAVGHNFDFTDKRYVFDQSSIAPNQMFGDSYVSSNLVDNVALEDLTTNLFVAIENKWLGDFRLQAGKSYFNYGYTTLLTQVNELTNEITNIPNRIKGDVFTVGGNYDKIYNGFRIHADTEAIVSGDLTGNYLNTSVGYKINDLFDAEVNLRSSSTAPNYNQLLYQSDYINYNWSNDFDNVNTMLIGGILDVNKIAKIDVSYSNITNHTYFTKDENEAMIAQQYSNTIDVLKVKLNQRLEYWKLGLDNTIMFQKVKNGNQIYNVPNLVSRNSLYYQGHLFDKALYLQAGATLKYFSKYNADSYDPVLSDFYVQNIEEIGGAPQFDIFINGKVRQTRIYFKYENITEAFRQNNQFSAPGYATRDAVLRFGIVWNFFL